MTYIRHFVNKNLSEGLSLPFTLLFNFRMLIEWWQQQAAGSDPVMAEQAMLVLKKIEHIPDLLHPIAETDDLGRFQPEIEMLLEPFFPVILTNFDFKAAGIPFKPMFFNHTARFAKLIEAAEGDVRIPMRDTGMMYIFACMTILNGYYGAGINFFHDLHFDFHDKKTGVPHRFLSKINSQFCEILPNGTPPALSQAEISELVDRFTDIDFWKQKIPPDSFRLEGFTIVTLFDVTRAESISALKYDLLNKEAFADAAIVTRIEQNICALLNTTGLRAGFMLYDKDRDLLKSVGSSASGNISLAGNNRKKPATVFGLAGMNRIFEQRQPYIIGDISLEKPGVDVLCDSLSEKGFRSYLAMPLFFGDSLVGILELAGTLPGMLSGMSVFTLQEILLLLTNVLNRLNHEEQNEVEAIIRQYCTAIHPTVAWRFTEAAENLLELNRGDYPRDAGMEDIIFNDVHPLYGQADIQDSSLARNKSIQLDLVAQLTLAKNILDLASSRFSLPVYKDLQFRTENYIAQIGEELNAGDENKIQEFFRDQLGPVFSYFHSMGGEMHSALLAYEQKLEPDTMLVYDKRKQYDLAVKLINEKISGYIDTAQVSAQKMFPHYLEKYKTDGVEHNLYIGQSMVQNRDYHPLYLQNLRLWQLLICCEIENEVKNIGAENELGLKICSLILVHSNPVSIRFRMDEKKFDVDGAYNIRYEILKKRIDKAHVKVTNQRLTQPGKLAIVYSQEKEANEYMNYLRYLQSINYIGPDIEKVELRDLQGITGLKALRVDIIYHPEFTGISQSRALELSMN